MLRKHRKFVMPVIPAPECKQNTITQSSFLSINERLSVMELRLKSIEQYQAHILDKLTVFAEMIDDLQTKV